MGGGDPSQMAAQVLGEAGQPTGSEETGLGNPESLLIRWEKPQTQLGPALPAALRKATSCRPGTEVGWRK